MDPVWVGIAFIFGIGARFVGLPPLVGFLIAGFVLNAFAIPVTADLQELSELGVTLLLFSIGLKLRVRTLLNPEVWASASVHMLITVFVIGVTILGLSAVGFSIFSGLDWTQSLLLGFALSFSSTVFAVKVLEERGEMQALHGRVAVGILIMQDIFAVLFLAFSAGKIPSPWALLLLGLIPLRPLIFFLMHRCGHGELLVLFGLLLG